MTIFEQSALHFEYQIRVLEPRKQIRVQSLKDTEPPMTLTNLKVA